MSREHAKALREWRDVGATLLRVDPDRFAMVLLLAEQVVKVHTVGRIDLSLLSRPDVNDGGGVQ